MPRKANAKNLGNVQLTPEQYTAARAEAKRRGLDMSQFIRQLLANNVSGFDLDAIPPRGTYTRQTVREQVEKIAAELYDRGHDPYDTATYLGINKGYVDGVFGWYVRIYTASGEKRRWLGRNLSEVQEFRRECRQLKG